MTCPLPLPCTPVPVNKYRPTAKTELAEPTDQITTDAALSNGAVRSLPPVPGRRKATRRGGEGKRRRRRRGGFVGRGARPPSGRSRGRRRRRTRGPSWSAARSVVPLAGRRARSRIARAAVPCYASIPLRCAALPGLLPLPSRPPARARSARRRAKRPPVVPVPVRR